MSIVEFLKDRVAEDEATARAAADSPAGAGATWFSCFRQVEGANHAQVADTQSSWYSDHMVRFDPARIIAECEAKRSIIKQHEDWPVLVEAEPEFGPLDITDGSHFAYSMSRKMAWLTECEYVKRFGSEPPTAPMIWTLAAVYSDHPDYQEDWK